MPARQVPRIASAAQVANVCGATNPEATRGGAVLYGASIMSQLRIGFLIDPLESLTFHHDTSFALMTESHRRGHEVWCFEQPHLGWREGRSDALMRRIAIRDPSGNTSGNTSDNTSDNTSTHSTAEAGLSGELPFEVLASERLPLSHLDVLFLRKDPPVDTAFLHATLLVDLAGENGPFLINSPAGLRDANEKLFGLRLPELGPPTALVRTVDEVRDFLRANGDKGILKPVDGFAGRGVLRVSEDDPNLASIVELLSESGRVAVVAQALLPVEKAGDKRILLLGGRPIGALLRLPKSGEVRANMAAGGRVERTSVTPEEQEICDRLAPLLSRHGLHFVGIDVIGGKLTEVNVTSPTGLVEIAALDDRNVAADVIDYAERNA